MVCRAFWGAVTPKVESKNAKDDYRGGRVNWQDSRGSASGKRFGGYFRLSTFAFLLGYAVAGGAATAYPTKPVRLIVPYPPGGGNDTLARLFGAKLTEAWGQQVVVDNRPGAGTIIGTQLAARAVPDGYTMLLSSIATHAIAPNLYSKPGFDPVKDFAPITLLAIAPTVLCVNAAVPANSVKELIALAKARPGELRFASGGSATPPHMAGEIFA